MNQNNVSLGRVTRKRMHEYYKNFVSDPDIFMDMSKYLSTSIVLNELTDIGKQEKNPKIEKTFLFC